MVEEVAIDDLLHSIHSFCFVDLDAQHCNRSCQASFAFTHLEGHHLEVVSQLGHFIAEIRFGEVGHVDRVVTIGNHLGHRCDPTEAASDESGHEVDEHKQHEVRGAEHGVEHLEHSRPNVVDVRQRIIDAKCTHRVASRVLDGRIHGDPCVERIGVRRLRCGTHEAVGHVGGNRAV